MAAVGPGDWQLGCTEMKQRGSHLLQSGQWSDCTFLVGTEPHQVIVNGHKLILAMASPVFEAMFFGGMAERNDPISILDVQPEAFKALLEYIYTDNINISSFDKACELCYGAKKYMLPHLVKECTRYLWSDLYPRNACRAYEFARLFEENVLMDKCIQIISTNTKEVLTDCSFEEVDLNTVITVFSLDHLNIDSELDLFEAAVRYSKAQDKRSERSGTPPVERRQSPGPSTSKEKVVNIESSAENSPAPVTDTCKAEGEPGPDHNDAKKKDDRGDAGAANTTNNTHKQFESALVTLENFSEWLRSELNSFMNTYMEKILAIETAVQELKKDITATADYLTAGRKKDKPTIRSAIEKIRFLTLTPQQFAEGPARSSLLTESEAFAVLMNILSSSSDVPLPSGFSTCRVPRKQLIGGSSNMPTFTVDTPSPVMEQVFGVETRPPQGCLLQYPRPARFDGARISSAVNSLPSSIMNPSLPLGSDHLERGSDFNRIYCQRAIIQQTDCLNTSVLDCSVTFMVDRNICLLGVQVPTQAPSEESAVCSLAGASNSYSELLYAHLLDADGARLTYTHYTNRVQYRHLLDIMFNRPVYIQRNKVYKVGIVFNKVGWYPLGTCAQQVAAESVFFNFGIGQSSDSVRDGLIRSIIFTY